jgi:hypothetical protein
MVFVLLRGCHRPEDEQRYGERTQRVRTKRQRRSARVDLDRCWDLLRQRRALRSAGGDPDEAAARDERTVEGYLQ